MIFRIIHPQFSFYLPFGFTRNIINNLFQETPTYNYTYPFTIDLDKDIDGQLGYLSEVNNKNIVSRYDVILEGAGKQYQAVLHVDEIYGKKAEVRVVYGLSSFPNEDKYLSDLPLFKQDINIEQESIYSIAKSIEHKTWPEVAYNFPAVHTTEEVVDTTREEWNYFRGTINLKEGGQFVNNEFDSEEYIQYNYNLMQPVPFAMHILEKGFEDAGFELEGDILDDEILKKTTVFNLSEFYSSITNGYREEHYLENDFEYTPMPEHLIEWQEYELNFLLPTPGRYKFAGYVDLIWLYTKNQPAHVKFYVDDVLVQSFEHGPNRGMHKYFNVDFNVEVQAGEFDVPVRIELKVSPLKLTIDNGFDIRVINSKVDITVSQLVAYDHEGNAIPTLQNPSVIDLRECVPKVTFFEFFEAIRKIRGYGPGIPEGNKFIVNKMELGQRSKAIDLSMYEFEPKRNTNKLKGIYFTWPERIIDYDNSIYNHILAKSDERIENPIKIDDDVIHFLFQAFPLKETNKNGFYAPLCFQKEDDDISLLAYDYIQATSHEVPEYFMDALINKYDEYIRIALENISFVEELVVLNKHIIDLEETSTIYMYGIYHLLDQVQITSISDKTSTLMLELKSL